MCSVHSNLGAVFPPVHGELPDYSHHKNGGRYQTIRYLAWCLRNPATGVVPEKVRGEIILGLIQSERLWGYGHHQVVPSKNAVDIAPGLVWPVDCPRTSSIQTTP